MVSKRIVVLVIASTNQPVYIHYINTYWTELIKYTNTNCPNLDVFLLFQKGEDVSPFGIIQGNIIIDNNTDFNGFFKPEEGCQIIPGVLSKLIYAYELLQHDYDIFFKTNLNCIMHISRFENFILTKNDIIYSGSSVWRDTLRQELFLMDSIGPDKSIKNLEELDTYEGNSFVAGPAIFLNKKEVQRLVSNKEKLRYDLIEDVSLGLMMTDYEYLPDFTLDFPASANVIDVIDQIVQNQYCHIRLEHFSFLKASELWAGLKHLGIELLTNLDSVRQKIENHITESSEKCFQVNEKIAYSGVNIYSRVKNLNNIFSNYKSIEKNIHIAWKNKNILNKDYNIIKYGILQLKELNPEYKFEISNDEEIDSYIREHVGSEDYKLIKEKHIVEKTDLWRLLKIYNEGGVYMDLDRFCNIPLKNIINKDVKCILPMHHDIDFSQDVMISCSKNLIHKRAIELNLKRRRDGCTEVLSLGPITYFNTVTEVLLDYQIKRYPDEIHLNYLRSIIKECKFLDTFREEPMLNTIFYQGPEIKNDKDEFYRSEEVEHWATICGNDEKNKPFGE
ncbi:MAG: glycosyltransferase [Saprospiraceae bacterium]